MTREAGRLRRPWLPEGVRRRVTLGILGVIVAAALAMGLRSYYATQAKLLDAVSDDAIAQSREGLRLAAANLPPAPSVDDIRYLLSDILRRDYEVVALYRGEAFPTSPRLDESSVPAYVASNAGAGRVAYQSARVLGEDRFVVGGRVGTDGPTLFFFHLLGPTNEVLDTLASVIWRTGVVVFVLAFVVAAIAGRVALRPAELAAIEIEKWGLDDLSRRVPVKGNDELAALARAFNTKADRLEDAIRSYQSYVQEAPHTMRDPVVELEDGLVELSAGRVAPQGLDVLAKQASVLREFVDNSLVYGDWDSGRVAVAWGPVVDLAARIEETLVSFYAREGLHTDLGGVKGTRTFVDPRMLTAMIWNLVANAYAHGRAPVTVRARHERESILIEVQDSGPGVPAGLAVFDLGVSTRKVGGVKVGGMGLAIVKRCAELQHGTVEVGNQPGACFTITLPRFDESPAPRQYRRGPDEEAGRIAAPERSWRRRPAWRRRS